jgi:rRNA-processing protein FCF1
MRLFVLDSSSLRRDPGILSLEKSDVRFVVPSGILTELNRGEAIPALIQEAVGLGTATIKETVTFGERAVLEAAHALQKEGREVVVVSEDREIRRFVGSFGIKVENSKECREDLQGSGVNIELEKSAKKIPRGERIGLILQSLGGFVLNYLAHLVWDKRSLITKSANVWGTLLLILASGILLYCLRSRFRLTYAVLEILIGFATAASVFYPSFDYKALDALALLRILGGLYIMVRGQDNISKALEGTRFEQRWKKFSGESLA